MTTPRGAALLHPDNGSVTRCHIEAAVRRIEEDAWPSGLAQDKVQRDRAMGGIDHDKDHAGQRDAVPDDEPVGAVLSPDGNPVPRGECGQQPAG